LLASAAFTLPAIATAHDPALSGLSASLLALLALLSALSPATGLLIMAATLPLAAPLAILGGDPRLAEIARLAFLAPVWARLALSRTGSPSRLTRPALLFLLVVVSSAVLDLSALQMHTTWPSAFGRQLFRHLVHDYFGPGGDFAMLHDIFSWCEAVGLALAADQILRRRPDAIPATTRMLLAGAGGLAACSAARLAEISLRAPDALAAAARFAWTLRFNPFYADLNAAGSLYALLVVPAIWLAWRGRRWLWLPAALLGLALWLAGSRAAIAGTIAGVIAAWIGTKRPSRRVLIVASTGARVLVALLAASSARNISVGEAARFRLALASATIRMTADSPAFGVGLDNFKPASAGLIAPAMKAEFPMLRSGENAHNNFLQILGELGAVGLAAFLWLLVTVGAAVRQSPPDTSRDERVALAAGLGAFLVTCLAGHPLLIEQVRTLFFFVGGLTMGMTGGAVRGASRLRRWSGIAALLVVAVALPLRLLHQRQHMKLQGVAYGAGPVLLMPGDGPYRAVGEDSSWFVSPAAREVEFWMRAAAPSPASCLVQVAFEGRPANAVEVSASTWTRLDVLTPGSRTDTWRHIDVHVSPPACQLWLRPIVEH
jgi:hypothetical protein